MSPALAGGFFLSFFLAVLGLHCFSLIAEGGGYALVVVHELLTVVASLAVEHELLGCLGFDS